MTTTRKIFGPPGEVFAVIHGAKGFVEVKRRAVSIPESFTVYPKQNQGSADRCVFKREMHQFHQKYEYATIRQGFV